ncbi:OmpH family outer membrane protein [Flavobacterium artemisiae]|uniref:OmpH family outer membrane protein n=1 Tax=Flavobacterium artemisiae TaxID=2126556 RepID=A0ABW4HB78_9FLAO
MKKNTTTVLLSINILLITILFSFIFIYYNSKSKIVYVNTIQLFENFTMTKEFKKAGEKEFNLIKTKVDSLYAKLQSVPNDTTEKKLLMEQFIQKKEELEKFNESFATKQSSKIWIRIKAYSTEFSKINNYQLILGEQNGTFILSADEKIDVTNALLSYLNKKYEGIE